MWRHHRNDLIIHHIDLISHNEVNRFASDLLFWYMPTTICSIKVSFVCNIFAQIGFVCICALWFDTFFFFWLHSFDCKKMFQEVGHRIQSMNTKNVLTVSLLIATFLFVLMPILAYKSNARVILEKHTNDWNHILTLY